MVSGIDMHAKVFIQSPAFKNPSSFYLMEPGKYHEQDVMEFNLDINDRKFYKSDKYKNASLQIVSGDSSKTIHYILINK